MSNRLRFDGLAELREALRNLPADLTQEASGIIEREAENAKAEMVASYPSRTGNLRKGVRVTHFEQGRFSAGALVKNTAPHAHLYEHGTQARHYISKKGAKHFTGEMWGRRPANPVFGRAMSRARRRMWARLKDLLVRNGLVVTGEP